MCRVVLSCALGRYICSHVSCRASGVWKACFLGSFLGLFPGHQVVSADVLAKSDVVLTDCHKISFQSIRTWSQELCQQSESSPNVYLDSFLILFRRSFLTSSTNESPQYYEQNCTLITNSRVSKSQIEVLKLQHKICIPHILPNKFDIIIIL